MERKLYRVCRAMRLNDADAQDAVQEALLKAYKNIENLREEKYFETWLIRTTEDGRAFTVSLYGNTGVSADEMLKIIGGVIE